MPRSATSPRKRPRQARARETVEAILAAATQLLERGGYGKLTTNRIAERAGVSIGSLYEYFPNKDAVVIAIMERCLDEQFAAFASVMHEVQGARLEEAVRRSIEVVVASKRERPQLIRALATTAPPGPRQRFLRRWNQRACEMVLSLLGGRDDLAGHPDLELTVFIVVNAVYGVMDAVIDERPELLEDDRLIEELTSLALGYLGR
ncbi:MAG TPA: TetR/AcrR family transcriptional regulator [Kofleriaceae bacterium]|nr:TetR/AcrR family transcriptional regulator [Kofleriaceae bacterium]